MLKRPIRAGGSPGNQWLFDADNRKLHSDGSEQVLYYAAARLRQDGQFAAAAFLEELDLPAGFPSCGLDAAVAEEIVSAVNSLAALAPQEGETVSECLDCGFSYADFPLDTTLPDDQWRMIHDSESGILCASCIVKRASKLPGIIAARMRLEFVDPPARGEEG